MRLFLFIFKKIKERIVEKSVAATFMLQADVIIRLFSRWMIRSSVSKIMKSRKVS